jgi:hypothetical protein
MAAPLDPSLRRLLENTIIKARELAQTAADAVITRLTIAEKEAKSYLTDKEKAVRNVLRAKARQLGDPWNASKQTFETTLRISHEIAYEHWHRMLFARFLSENNLLINPDFDVPVTLSDCEELAKEAAGKAPGSAATIDKWIVAGRFAATMLPQIFRPDEPALQVDLAPEHQQALEGLLEALPGAVFTADDSLGWVYQFWQSAEKERVNGTVKGGAKITGETLPAVTQLFTEHYMVLFLLHNTVGAWHAARQLAKLPRATITAWETEADARAAVALPGYDFEYLRFVRDDVEEGKPGAWRPAAGGFTSWPKTAKDLRLLDPSCGSGHFLVASFELMLKLRMHEERLEAQNAALAVVAENIHGLELDARCTQLAAFNVALAAWKSREDGPRHFALPAIHVACSGLAVGASKAEWAKLAGGDEALKAGMERLHDLFQQAPDLGSLIDPRGSLAYTRGGKDEFKFDSQFESIQPLLANALRSESVRKDNEAHERAVTAQGMAKAAEILSSEYTLVITNVPYLGRGGQGDVIKAFCEQEYPEAKADLATVFVSRMLKWVGEAGTIAAVTPQNWLFLTSYKKLRERLLKERSWNMVARLGHGAFETIGGHVVNVALITASGEKPSKAAIMAGIDASAAKLPAEKASLLRGEPAGTTETSVPSLDGPAAPAAASMTEAERHHAGVSPGRDGTANASTEATADVDVEEGAGAEPGEADGSIKQVPQAEQLKNPDSRILLACLSQPAMLSAHADSFEGMTAGDLSRFVMQFWEVSLPHPSWEWFVGASEVNAAWAARDQVIRWEGGNGPIQREGSGAVKGREAWGRAGVRVHQMQTMGCTLYAGELFDKNAASVTPNKAEHLSALYAFCQSSQFRTAVRKVDQALKITVKSFTKVPFDLAHWQQVAAEKYPGGTLPEPQSDDPTQWLFHGHPAGRVPLTADPDTTRSTALQVAVARLVSHRWPAELDPKMRLAPEARAWVERCKDLHSHADDDGVVPLVPINKELPGADRLRALLEDAFGDRWSPNLLNDLLAAAGEGAAGKTLDDWLRGGDFWAQHCATFHNRPFVWQIWDGRKDGFNVLVHYHRLAAPNGEGRKLLEKITYTYLNDWLSQQNAAAGGPNGGVPGAAARVKAAEDLQQKLKAILAGEPPYDLFVRWKPLHQQPIGWDPDINDGVRINIRPFVTAGILRGKVNVKWTKDRGKEPQSIRPRDEFPWFWSCPEDAPPVDFGGGAVFTGERLNDLHYTTEAKKAACRK